MKRFIFRALDQYAFKSFGHQQWKAGVQHGVKCEQERIIKLLEDRFDMVFSASKKPEKERYIMGWQDAIAVTKGEK